MNVLNAIFLSEKKTILATASSSVCRDVRPDEQWLEKGATKKKAEKNDKVATHDAGSIIQFAISKAE